LATTVAVTADEPSHNTRTASPHPVRIGSRMLTFVVTIAFFYTALVILALAFRRP